MHNNFSTPPTVAKALDFLLRIRDYCESPDSPLHECWVECTIDGAAGAAYMTRDLDRALEVAHAARSYGLDTSKVYRECRTFIDMNTDREWPIRVWVVYIQGIIER